MRTSVLLLALISLATEACGTSAVGPGVALARAARPRLPAGIGRRLLREGGEDVPFASLPAKPPRPVKPPRTPSTGHHPRMVVSTLPLEGLPSVRIPRMLEPAAAPRAISPDSGAGRGNEVRLVIELVPDEPPDIYVQSKAVRIGIAGLALAESRISELAWSFRAREVVSEFRGAQCGSGRVEPVRAEGIRRIAGETGDRIEYVVVDGWFDRARCAVQTVRTTSVEAAALVRRVVYGFRIVPTDGFSEHETVSLVFAEASTLVSRSRATEWRDVTRSIFTRVTLPGAGAGLAESMVARIGSASLRSFQTSLFDPDAVGEALFLGVDVVDNGQPVVVTAVGLDGPT